MEKQKVVAALNSIVNKALNAPLPNSVHQQTLAEANILDAFLTDAFKKNETVNELKDITLKS